MNLNKKVIASVAVVLIAVVGYFIYSSTGKETKETATNNANATKEIVLKHKLGEIKLQDTPKNIVVFDYATVDSLDKLGVEIAALPKSNLPGYLDKFKDDKYVNAGTLFEPDFEKVQSLKPDLILISGRQTEVYEKLNKIAPTFFFEVSTKDYIGSVKENVTTLGKIFNKEDAAKTEVTKLEEATKSLNETVKASGKNALTVMANEGKLSAFGSNSRFGTIHREFGFPQADDKIEESNHGMNVSFEYIAEKNPDYLFIVDRSVATSTGEAASKTLDNDIIKKTNAYKNKHIIYLDTSVWYLSSGGLTGTNKMIEEVGAALK